MKGATLKYSVPICDLPQNLELTATVFGDSIFPSQMLTNAVLAQVDFMSSRHVPMNWDAEVILVSGNASFIAFVPASEPFMVNTHLYRQGLNATVNILNALPDLSNAKRSDLVVLKSLVYECRSAPSIQKTKISKK